MSGRECLRVYVLGRFRLFTGEESIATPSRARKPKELLQALIAFGGSDVNVNTLTDALWPDSDGDVAYHALETVLYRLRRLLGDRAAVRLEGGKLSLDRDQLRVDMWEFEEHLRRSHDRLSAADRIGCMRGLYRGHFLQHETEKPWIVQVRQELRDRIISTVREAAREVERGRDGDDAASLYQFGIDLDPLNESFYRSLMLCHLELGEDSEALRTYGRCRDLLARNLGVSPNAKTQSLYQSVRDRATRGFSHVPAYAIPHPAAATHPGETLEIS